MHSCMWYSLFMYECWHTMQTCMYENPREDKLVCVGDTWRVPIGICQTFMPWIKMACSHACMHVHMNVIGIIDPFRGVTFGVLQQGHVVPLVSVSRACGIANVKWVKASTLLSKKHQSRLSKTNSFKLCWHTWGANASRKKFVHVLAPLRLAELLAGPSCSQ